MLLFDPEGRPVSAGEIGEISVRSRYLAAGYWDRPDLTEVAFAFPPSATARACHLGRRDRVDLVPGDHESCLTTEAGALADRLRACLTA